MIEGIIIRGVGGNYYVDIGDKMIECRARGLFRLKNIKPLVGDRVLIRITEEDEDAGYIEEIIDRKSEIKRPNIANAQQLIIIFSVKNPEPSFLLMDKLLIAASSNKLDPVICINKSDLADEGEKDKILEIFKNTTWTFFKQVPSFTSMNPKFFKSLMVLIQPSILTSLLFSGDKNKSLISVAFILPLLNLLI
jgi:ribosome small subunit-dependent GTPase A